MSSWCLKKPKAEVCVLSQTSQQRFSVIVTALPVFHCENANTLGLLGVCAPMCKTLNYSNPQIKIHLTRPPPPILVPCLFDSYSVAQKYILILQRSYAGDKWPRPSQPYFDPMVANELRKVGERKSCSNLEGHGAMVSPLRSSTPMDQDTLLFLPFLVLIIVHSTLIVPFDSGFFNPGYTPTFLRLALTSDSRNSAVFNALWFSYTALICALSVICCVFCSL